MEKTISVSISLPESLKQKIDKISETEDRSRSIVITRLIKLALEDYEDGAYK